MATPAWHPGPAFSTEMARGHREAARRQPRGCVQSPRLEDITRLSAGGASPGVPEGVPEAAAPGRGQPATKRALFFPPPELEPMDWRQLRSSARQSRGSGSGWGPRARASMDPHIGWSQLEQSDRWLLVLELSFRSVPQGKLCLSCPPLGLAVGLEIGCILYSMEGGEPGSRCGGYTHHEVWRSPRFLSGQGWCSGVQDNMQGPPRRLS